MTKRSKPHWQASKKLIEAFDRQISLSEQRAQDTLGLLKSELVGRGQLTAQNTELYERLLAETQRRSYLEGKEAVLSTISAEQDAQVVTMAAPLLKEMAVPLRRSASRATINIEDDQGNRPILSADKAMDDDVELTLIDPAITPLLINILQYNKENGWGKFRNLEFNGLTSFSVPADRKMHIQTALLNAMNEADVYVQCYYVRSVTGIKLRIIIVDFIDIESLESGGL